MEAASLDQRTHGWKAFASWVLCGLVWGLAWFGILSVGPIILPFAVVLTILLLKDGLSPRARRMMWIGFGVWFGVYVLVLLQLLPIGFFIYIAALLVFGEIRQAGVAAFGLLVGIGLWPVWIAVGGGESATAFLISGLVMIAVGAGVFVWRRAAERERVAAANESG